MRHYSHRARLAALETDVNSKYLCLSALAALLDAAEHAHKTSFVKGTLAISFKPVEGVMLLDTATVGARAARAHANATRALSRLTPYTDPARSPAHASCCPANLELLRNLRTGDPKLSLFGTLNHCLTSAVRQRHALANRVVVTYYLPPVAPTLALRRPCADALARLACVLAQGTRFLRSSLIQPSTDLATITARLDAVSEVRASSCVSADWC